MLRSKSGMLTGSILTFQSTLVDYYNATDGVNWTHRQTSNTSRTLVGSKIDDHSDVVGAPPVGAAPTTFSYST